MLQLVGLEQAAKRRIGGFSGGMVQRMGIAQALLHRPPVLFLDEPTSSLDPAGRYEVLELITQLRGRVTVFLSSHILSDIERVCDTVAIIREGKLVLVAGREELLDRYTANVVEIELDLELNPDIEPFLNFARNQAWIASVTVDQNILRVAVHDLKKGKQKLLQAAADHQLVINRYEWVHPTLEEVFLKVSA